MKKRCNKFVIFALLVPILFASMPLNASASSANVEIENGYDIVNYLSSKMIDLAFDTIDFTGELYMKAFDDALTQDKKYYTESTQNPMDFHNSNNTYNTSNTSNSSNYYTDSGADYNNCYNTSKINSDNKSFSLVKDSYNSTTNNYDLMIYNPVTQTYNTTNNVSYNEEYNTYYFETNEYNYYVTNNYTYVSYYIVNNVTNNTTYNEIYFEMPDGRNSYDLEKEDIWGEYFIYDVIGYESIMEDDGQTLALYHFENNGRDASARQGTTLPVGTGLFESGKFGMGLSFPANYNYQISLPVGFDCDNYTVEFFLKPNATFSSKTYGFVVGTGNDNISVYFYNKITAPGIYHVAICSENGIETLYFNGERINNSSKDNISSAKTLVSLYDYTYGTSSNHYFKFYFPDYPYIIDELRFSNKCIYHGENIDIPSQEFDTNQVLTLPKNVDNNTIAVMSKIPVANYRVGGARPTYPSKGDVFISLEKDTVVDIQQYEGDGWYSIGGAIYRDEEWHNLMKFNLSPLSSGTGGSSGSGGSSGGGSVSGGDSGGGSGLSSLLDGLGEFFEAILTILGRLLEYISKAVNLLVNVIADVIDIVPSTFTDLLTALFPFIPQEWVVAIELMLVLSVILIAVKAFK